PILESGGGLLASGRQYASIVLGQDMAIGFIGPVGEKLEFSISESLALLIRQPGAICVLKG
ncbi:MAG TPA: bacteriocin, partial [Anaerolineae bacterium]|nr:bacteriocin [Anaerolineae bacterium]